MNLQDYIASKKAPKKVKADIQERWQSRVVAAGLDTQGEAGAEVYLSNYGTNIGLPKVLDLAFCALSNGATAMANGFFKKAAQMENVALEVSDAGNKAAYTAVIIERKPETANHPGFPANMQPGKLSPMQPVDGKYDRETYIADHCYWGQPKIDGIKMIVFATPDEVFYQSRQLKLNPQPNAGLNNVLRQAAAYFGNFILEGELTFLDYEGKEHRTAPQALTANQEPGYGNALPRMQYVVFSCLWNMGEEFMTYGDMVYGGWHIASWMEQQGSSIVKPILTAKSPEEKRDLALAQSTGGREGEVWFHHLMPYVAGKHKDERFIRTKYLMEFEVDVIGFTASTNPVFAFGAMEIADTAQGHYYGNVGTGFTLDERRMLKDKFENEGSFKVKIRTQGLTETGIAWHARFLEIVK